jgi:uncharacterized membrane protein
MNGQKKVITPSTLTIAQTSPEDSSKSSKNAGSTEDKLMSSIIGWLLQGGVLLSSAIIIAGLILLLRLPDPFSAKSVGTLPHTPLEIWTGLLALQPQAVIVLGLLLLIATPVLRVAVSVIAFGLEHDMRYVIITLIVLAILITSFLLGRGGA